MTRQDEMALADAALKAMRRAVRRVRREHRMTGRPLYVLKRGKLTAVVLHPKRKAKKPARASKG